LKKRGIKGAATALALRDEGEKTETTLAFGKMLVAALAGASAYLLLRGLEPPVAVIAALGLAALFGFLGLLLPRAYARKRADRMAVALAAPTVAAVAVLAPPAALLEKLATAVMRLARVNGGEGSHTVHEDLRETIDLHAKEGTVFKNDRDMLSGILAIQDLTIADIMVHRTKMTTIDGSEPPGEIVAKVLKSGHTRIPVWNGSPDNIIGVLHAKNLFAALQKHGGDASKIDIEDILLPPWFVPDTRAIPDQLNAFLKRKSHFAIVVDEYGEVQGLVTLEDIIEEIVGDIKDEHDAVASGVRPKPDGSYLVDGGVPIRDLNRAFDWSLPDEEANTIAGLVIHEARTIPEPGQTFTFHGFRFQVLRKQRNRITSLRITPLEKPKPVLEADAGAAKRVRSRASP
jgi:Mg2+/Co2+ transporter CorB